MINLFRSLIGSFAVLFAWQSLANWSVNAATSEAKRIDIETAKGKTRLAMESGSPHCNRS